MTPITLTRVRLAALLVTLLACTRGTLPVREARTASVVGDALQLVVVTTPAWTSTTGTLRRYERATPSEAWRGIGAEVAVVVGQSGLGWDDAIGAPGRGDPVKREGDGRAPAGAFALDTAFGFSRREAVPWIRLPYVHVEEQTVCVDDSFSEHYNTIVDRRRARQDWTSAERMREIYQYRLGVHVAYNASPAKRMRGSCIFLHVWASPRSPTAGCTAMDAAMLEDIVRWLDPARRPMLVQLPVAERDRLRVAWALP